MAKVSNTVADLVEQVGPVLDRASEAEGHTLELVTFKEDVDMAPILAPLPGGHCSCPHWGYMVEGHAVIHYADHDEELDAGDVFYMAPGHVPDVRAGTVLAMISPTDQLTATDAAIRAAMAPG